MGSKVIKLAVLIAFVNYFSFTAIKADNLGGNAEHGDVIVQKQIPIVIKTPERNYDQPSFSDFEKCAREYDKCRNSCESSSNDLDECMKGCPKCPMLVIQNSVVQGINDTDFKALKPSVVNTTNIIRLTNQIHNVIDNNLDITARSENNVHIHTKNSTIGGKYGYGYTEHGPCCMVVRNHDHKQRLCGERCRAPVMHARPVVQCVDDMDINSCREVIEYKPHRQLRHTPSSTHNRCRYQQAWPFVSCRSRRQYDTCSPRCLELAYGYILRYGVPLHCVNCFKNFERSGSNPPPLGYLPPAWTENGDGNEFIGEDGWTLEKTKCRNADGTISDDCITEGEIGSGDDEFLFPADEKRARVEERDRKFAEAAFDSFEALDAPRHRRNTFRRSKYSKRYKAEKKGEQN